MLVQCLRTQPCARDQDGLLKLWPAGRPQKRLASFAPLPPRVNFAPSGPRGVVVGSASVPLARGEISHSKLEAGSPRALRQGAACRTYKVSASPLLRKAAARHK